MCLRPRQEAFNPSNAITPTGIDGPLSVPETLQERYECLNIRRALEGVGDCREGENEHFGESLLKLIAGHEGMTA
jgi:hypothetical protein